MKAPWLIAALVTVLVLAGCARSSDESIALVNGNADPDAGTVPNAAKEIFAKRPYQTARWTYLIEDLDSGEVSLAKDAGVMAQTGSTAKLFTIGSAYETFGPEHTIATPVYGLGSREGGTLDGELVLVGMGDPTLGGRGGTEGRVDFADGIDSVYAPVVPGTTAPNDDPLAGLAELAAEVSDAGISAVGDVVVDDRLFETFVGQGGTVTPIFVADNQVTITVTPTEPGEPAEVELSPEIDLFDLRADVVTADDAAMPEDISAADIGVVPDPEDPNKATVTGQIAANAGPTLTAFAVPDAAAFARALFVGELEAAGVEVGGAGAPENDESGLPEPGGYSETDLVASYTSPPLEEFGRMILNTSYNNGANDMLCLLAVERGSEVCTDGLSTIRELVVEAGIPVLSTALVDGQGADPAAVTPEAIVAWLRWTTDQPWGEIFEQSIPVLGVSGTQKMGEEESPARGKVAAKPGTSAHPLPDSSELYILTQGLAGFLDTEEGKKLFSLYTSGPVFTGGLQGLFESGEDVNAVSAAFQQDPG